MAEVREEYTIDGNTVWINITLNEYSKDDAVADMLYDINRKIADYIGKLHAKKKVFPDRNELVNRILNDLIKDSKGGISDHERTILAESIYNILELYIPTYIIYIDIEKTDKNSFKVEDVKVLSKLNIHDIRLNEYEEVIKRNRFIDYLKDELVRVLEYIYEKDKKLFFEILSKGLSQKIQKNKDKMQFYVSVVETVLNKEFVANVDDMMIKLEGRGVKLGEIINSLMALEGEGRELAYKMVSSDVYDEELDDKIVRWAEKAFAVLDKIMNDKAFERTLLMNDAVYEFLYLIQSLLNDIYSGWKVLSMRGFAEKLRKIDSYARKLGLAGVVWGYLGDWSSILNSASACVHRVAELLQRYGGKRYLILSKNPNALEWARSFLTTFALLSEFNIYSPDDKEFSTIIITDNDISMRLGSSQGHSAHINIKEGVLEYYDNDADVCVFLAKIIKKFLPNSKFYIILNDERKEIDPDQIKDLRKFRKSSVDGLAVTFDPTAENIKTLCSILPIAISLDFMLSGSVSYKLWSSEPIFKYNLTRIAKALGIDIDLFNRRFTDFIKEIVNSMDRFQLFDIADYTLWSIRWSTKIDVNNENISRLTSFFHKAHHFNDTFIHGYDIGSALKDYLINLKNLVADYLNNEFASKRSESKRPALVMTA